MASHLWSKNLVRPEKASTGHRNMFKRSFEEFPVKLPCHLHLILFPPELYSHLHAVTTLHKITFQCWSWAFVAVFHTLKPNSTSLRPYIGEPVLGWSCSQELDTCSMTKLTDSWQKWFLIIIFDLLDHHSKALSYTNVTKVNNTSPVETNKCHNSMEHPGNVSINPYITLNWPAPA